MKYIRLDVSRSFYENEKYNKIHAVMYKSYPTGKIQRHSVIPSLVVPSDRHYRSTLHRQNY